MADRPGGALGPGGLRVGLAGAVLAGPVACDELVALIESVSAAELVA